MTPDDMKQIILKVLERWGVYGDSELSREMIADDIVAEYWKQLPDHH